MTAHLRGEGMSCIDDQTNRFCFYKSRQPFHSAEPANSHATHEIARRASQSSKAIDVFRTETPRDRQCFARAAEQQDARHDFTAFSSVMGSA